MSNHCQKRQSESRATAVNPPTNSAEHTRSGSSCPLPPGSRSAAQEWPHRKTPPFRAGHGSQVKWADRANPLVLGGIFRLRWANRKRNRIGACDYGCPELIQRGTGEPGGMGQGKAAAIIARPTAARIKPRRRGNLPNAGSGTAAGALETCAASSGIGNAAIFSRRPLRRNWGT